MALAIRAFGGTGATPGAGPVAALTVAGDALAAGADEAQTAGHVARLAVEATGALASLLWLSADGRPLELVASFGLVGTTPLTGAREAAERALQGRVPVAVDEAAGKLPALSEASNLCFGRIGRLSSRRRPGANAEGKTIWTVCGSTAVTSSWRSSFG